MIPGRMSSNWEGRISNTAFPPYPIEQRRQILRRTTPLNVAVTAQDAIQVQRVAQRSASLHGRMNGQVAAFAEDKQSQHVIQIGIGQQHAFDRAGTNTILLPWM